MRALLSLSTARPVIRRLPRLAMLGSAGLSAGLLWTSTSDACGPCTTPELWDVQQNGTALTVVTTFGLLTRMGDDWQLSCEEIFGGLLLSARAMGDDQWVSTENGVFQRSSGNCDWRPGPSLVSNRWAWKFSLAPGPLDTVTKFALVIDAETQALQVERSLGEDEFEVVHSFDRTSGFRDLIAGGTGPSVFVSGYAPGDPRPWQVAFSHDGGVSWEIAIPQAPSQTNLVLRLVDAMAPRAVLIESKTVAGLGEELWRFDSESGEMQRLLQLDDGELLGGVSLDGDTLWVAGRGESGGSLYRADRERLDFARVVSRGPAFGCLAADAGVLYACVNDFGYTSDFIVARSVDEGLSWQTEMTADDLAHVKACTGECQVTLDWLTGTFGMVGAAGSGGSGAEVGDAAGASGAGPESAPEREPSRGSCDCVVAPQPTGDAGFVLAWLVTLGAWCRRQRQRLARSQTLAVPLTLVGGLLLACSETERDSVGVDEPGCEGRGDDLKQLEAESSERARLDVLSIDPEPPVAGDNAWLVEIIDRAGVPLTELAGSLRVTPFMPDHQHGTPVAVVSEEVDPGRYRLAPLNMFMPGLWQITVEWELDQQPDSAAVSVCVE